MGGSSIGRKRRISWSVGLAALVTVAGIASSGALTRAPSGPFDATGETPHGWGLTPAGRQTDVGPGPQAVAVSPDGRMVVVANAGYLDHSLMVLDPATGSITQTIRAKGGKAKGSAWTYLRTRPRLLCRS